MVSDNAIYYAERLRNLQALEKNKHFKGLITKGLFQDRVLYLVSRISNAEGRDRELVMRELHGISTLINYFETLKAINTPIFDDSNVEIEDIEEKEEVNE